MVLPVSETVTFLPSPVLDAPMPPIPGTPRVLTAILFGVVLVMPFRALGQCELDKVVPLDGQGGDRFGTAVSLHGEFAVIGAPGDDDGGADSGSAYVYQLQADSSLIQVAKLAAGDRVIDSFFGVSVDIDGDFIIVGSLPTSGSGAGYVFHRDGIGWPQQRRLNPVLGFADDRFGSSVAIAGDWAAVAAPGDSGRGENSGAVYVFRRSGDVWIQKAKLTASDTVAGDLLGSALSMDGLSIAAGAPGHSSLGLSGAAYVFTFDGVVWRQESKIVPHSAETIFFGSSISIDDDHLVVGAIDPADVDDSNPGGHVYLRFGTSWSFVDDFVISDAFTIQEASAPGVAVTADLVVLGAKLHKVGGIVSGSATILERSGFDWPMTAQFTASDGAEGDNYGDVVAADAALVLVGSPDDDDRGIDSGAAYFYHALTQPDCNNDGLSDFCALFTGLSNDADTNGLPDECVCEIDAECDDGLFCNGAEFCENSACEMGSDPCEPGEVCDETDDECVECISDADCNDFEFCDGVETCGADKLCNDGTAPCADDLVCNEETDACVPCVVDRDCDEGDPCTGDLCEDGNCTHVEFPICPDFDGDGVDDDVDLCLGTAAGDAVDPQGCACVQLDDDADRVSNCTDDCPDTGRGAVVDNRGCAVVAADPPTDGGENDNSNEGDGDTGQPVPNPGDDTVDAPPQGDGSDGEADPPPVDETPAGQDQATTETSSGRSSSRSTCGSFGFGSIALLIGGWSFLIRSRRGTPRS